MVWTQAQTAKWYNNEMGLTNQARAHLMADDGAGYSSVQDLGELDQEYWEKVVEQIRHPPAGQNGIGISAESESRILASIYLIRYYLMTGRSPEPANMHWAIGSEFQKAYKELVRRRDADPGDPPKLTKHTDMLRWMDNFDSFLTTVVGNRLCPLSYVIRDSADVKQEAPPALATNKPYSTEHSSVEAEMVALANHSAFEFGPDNHRVFDFVDTATQGTEYQTAIKLYRKKKDGRGAFMALKRQYAGKDTYARRYAEGEKMIAIQWKGTGHYPMSKHVQRHRIGFGIIETCAPHMSGCVPTATLRVRRLLDSIVTSDPSLHAAITLIEQDDVEGGMRNDFEKAATALQRADPVNKRLSSDNSKRNLSGVDGADIGLAVILKQGRGPKTGVHLRWHPPKEFKALQKPERDELQAWRKKYPKEANESKQQLRKDDARIGSLNGSKTKKPKGSNDDGMDKKSLEHLVSALTGFTNALSSASAGDAIAPAGATPTFEGGLPY
eukprot:CAMPEP_0168722126 /NCGR_PEP_ID=MMETSP0724-20121128/2437_1 /TAXON_ID=265536 /ORGANISM="Amphiprora sp., Strain CCMP467" /LENGTH=497 /DNA_ID=CAMNT_0008768789 /DNA_START=329 /DNA_END=1822 /DNA_ORIENTATION=-